MRINLKFFAIPIFLFAFIALLIHFYPQEANAILSHRQEKVNSYLDSDGNTIEVFNLYVSISGSSEVNHVEGEITLNNLSLINFEINPNFIVESLSSDKLKFSLTSNKVFTASDSKVVYATVTVKQIANSDCNFLFRPITANKVNTNNFQITKEAYKNNTIISEIEAGTEFQYKITVTGINQIASDTVTVSDTIPSTLEIINAGTGIKNGQTITWNLGSFAPGTKTITLWVTVKAKANISGTINNTATLRVGDKTISDDTTVKVVYSNITITKSASKSTVIVGEEFYYDLVIKNTGTGTSKNITVVDYYDNDLTYLNATMVPSSTAINTITFNIGTLDANKTKTIRLYFKVKNSTNKTKIPNRATATEEGKNPVESTVEIEVLKPNLTIKKNVSSTIVKRGDTFNYTITITNNGKTSAKNVQVTDTINNNFEIINTSVGSYNNNIFTANFTTININETKTISIKVRVKNTAPLGTISNIATVKSDNTPEISDDEDIIVTDSNLEIKKEASKKILAPGEAFSYTITIKNKGTAAANNIIVKDTLNSNLILISSDNATVNGNTLTWNINSLGTNASKTYTINVRVKENITNNLTIPNIVTAKEPDKEEIQDEEDIIVKKPILTIEKTVDNLKGTKLIKAGEEFYYNIKVTNKGEVPSSQITITDTLNELLTIIDANSGTINNQTITWTINSLNANQSINYRIKVKLSDTASPNTQINNIAILTHKEEKLEDDDTITVVGPNIYILKDASKKQVEKDEEFYYTIKVGNLGSTAATNLLVTDTIPDKLILLNYNIGDGLTGSSEGNKLTVNIPILNPNTEIIIHVYVVASDSVVNNEIITNTAVLTDKDKKIESSVNVTVIDTDISVIKSASVDKLTNDEIFFYSITVNNNGNVDAYNLKVIDTFDESKLKILDTNGNLNGNQIEWNIPILKAKDSITYKIKAQVQNSTENDQIKNSVVVKEPDKPDKTDEVTIPVVALKLNITKSVSKEEVVKGDTFDYFLTITNESNLALKDLIISDKLDDNLEVIDASNGTNDNNYLSWIISLEANETKIIKINVRLKKECSLDEIANIAKITYQDKEKESNEVIIKTSDVANPPTGNIVSYVIISIGSITGLGIFGFAKRKKRIYKI
ncbi:MAG: isopeptide-forming domain-containing fimbrial protein [Bacilli bacterium]|nr:isopeptide-forming domain-containing fimbrial protein [Bacilli bacterium]